jgi:hypothetical protein
VLGVEMMMVLEPWAVLNFWDLITTYSAWQQWAADLVEAAQVEHTLAGRSWGILGENQQDELEDSHPYDPVVILRTGKENNQAHDLVEVRPDD